MIKHLKILEYALTSMLRRRFKNLAIVSVFSMVTFVIASIVFLTHAFKKEALLVLEDAPQLIVQRIQAGRHALIPLERIKEIKALPGVGRVRPRYWGYYYDPLTGANLTVMTLDSNIKEGELISGKAPSPEERGVCLIGWGIADRRFLQIGDQLFLKDLTGKVMSLRVKGIFKKSSQLLTNDLVLIGRDDFMRLFGFPEAYATDITVEVFNPEEVSNIARKVKELYPDTRPITRDEILRTYDSLFNWRGGMMLTMFLGVVLAFVILAWDKATGLSAEERQEIGILKAIGWETSDVLLLKFWEGTAVSLFSYLTGILLAYIHVFYLGAVLFEPALKGWSVLFPQFRLKPFVDMYQCFVLFMLTVIPYTAATLIPSWKAAITDPDSVMRG
ncbi:MAG: FtsX-like permease family protein [Nitrospirae bacterium]|nr:MAG: FtsX-like permease family protein [Nitrospirota bacterium]